MLSAKNINLEDHCVTFQDSVVSKNITVEEIGKSLKFIVFLYHTKS